MLQFILLPMCIVRVKWIVVVLAVLQELTLRNALSAKGYV